MPDRDSVTIGVWVEVGSRYEDDATAGVSHFLEHMVFKATPTRSAREIALEVERLGGSLNAFTSREHTCYHARVVGRDLPTALEILADLSTRATLPAAEVQKERLVIAEEIKDAHDTPNEWVHDLFAMQMWPGHSIGRSIAGTIPTVMGTTRETLHKHRARFYRPDRMLIAACGNLSHAKLVSLVKKAFTIDTPTGRVEAPSTPNGAMVQRGVAHREINQTHVCLGFPLWKFADPRRHTVLVISNILGGGMSSRLFQSVREQRGLVYAIYPIQDSYQDAGFLGVYFACDPKHMLEASNLVLKEMGQLAYGRIGATELDDVKSQLRGNLLLGLESTSSRMHRIARHELYLGDYVTPAQTMKAIRKVSAADIRNVASEAFVPDRLAMAVLGPVPGETVGKVDLGALQRPVRSGRKRLTARPKPASSQRKSPSRRA